jgi:hypothetical protein
MTNKIKRLTDDKFLISSEEDTWTEDIDEASGFNREECDKLQISLLDRLQPHEIEVCYGVYDKTERIRNGIEK